MEAQKPFQLLLHFDQGMLNIALSIRQTRNNISITFKTTDRIQTKASRGQRSNTKRNDPYGTSKRSLSLPPQRFKLHFSLSLTRFNHFIDNQSTLKDPSQLALEYKIDPLTRCHYLAHDMLVWKRPYKARRQHITNVSRAQLRRSRGKDLFERGFTAMFTEPQIATDGNWNRPSSNKNFLQSSDPFLLVNEARGPLTRHNQSPTTISQ